MICPTCHATIDGLEAPRVACGRASTAVVEGSLAVGTPPEANLPTPLESTTYNALSPGVSSSALAPVFAGQAHVALAALMRVPALVWRQPAMRVAVRTGASAVLLSLAVRMAERLIMERGVHRAVSDDNLSTLAQALMPATPSGRSGGAGRGRRRAPAKITETLVYIRRVSY